MFPTWEAAISQYLSYNKRWKRAGVAERTRLESVRQSNLTKGSNPFVSAKMLVVIYITLIMLV